MEECGRDACKPFMISRDDNLKKIGTRNQETGTFSSLLIQGCAIFGSYGFVFVTRDHWNHVGRSTSLALPGSVLRTIATFGFFALCMLLDLCDFMQEVF